MNSVMRLAFCLLPHDSTQITEYRTLDWLLTDVTNTLRPCGQFNIQQFYVLPTQCIYVFCVDLRTNSDYLPIQH